MLKKSSGNMYPWVTHTWSVLRGRCPHRCSYCYVNAMALRFPSMRERATGPLCLDQSALETKLGAGRTIFVEHLNDLFADLVDPGIILQVLAVCRMYPGNTYVFQTKNPKHYRDFLGALPANHILGTTIETNRDYSESIAPRPVHRAEAMRMLPRNATVFVTIEPILDFDLDPFVSLLQSIHPNWVNIGADSKGRGLSEPSPERVKILIARLQSAGIEVRQKSNLTRLVGQASRLSP